MIIIAIINFYQKFISPDQSIFSRKRKYCVFEPSCSQYTKEAIMHGGIFYGLKKGFLRIIRCHPFQKNLFDPFKS
ncbi:membrane protein insertion efficiency factor YidD [Candidatus Giovannonibacteria bacterium]|nr:membrane protein insertion efficiency factor YidD [Candidatus Giovannonibacteria bacterium]